MKLIKTDLSQFADVSELMTEGLESEDTSESSSTDLSSSLASTDSELDTLREILTARLQSDTPDVVKAALLDLVAMLSDKKDQQGAVSRIGCDELEAPTIVVACIKKWLHSEDIQIWGLSCMHMLN